MAKRRGVKEVYVHALLDGRDVAPTSGAGYVKALVEKCAELGTGKIATIQGRFYGMDRDKRWDRVEKGYRAVVCGEGVQDGDPVHAVEESYKAGVTDEFVVPTVCDKNGCIRSGDSVIFINFRPDRARQLTRAMTEEAFTGFARKTGYLKPDYVCFTQYDATFRNVEIAFRPQSLSNTLGAYLAQRGYTQLRIAETEKYAHVTFFFNGGVEAPNANEDRDLIPSPKVATYDLKPEMSAFEVTEKVLEELDSDKYDVVILNFANCDMVGHTGVLEAAVKAVETVDTCMGRVVDKILEKGGVALITADHGNADKMIAEDGSPFTAHTTNPVPFILAGDGYIGRELRTGGILADIAPTLLTVMGEKIPPEMTGKSLIVQK